MSYMKHDSRLTHSGKQGVHYLHGILRRWKNTMIFLKNQFYSFILKPSQSTLMIKGTEQTFHKLIAARICG